MMKKLLFVFVPLFAMALSLVSCSDKDAETGSGSGPEGKEMADYTVIFWGMAGGMDGITAPDMATLASNYQKGLIGKKVNIAGLIKTSIHATPSQDKTWYFDSEKINEKTVDNTPEIDIYTIDTRTKEGQKLIADYAQAKYDFAFETLNSREYGDALYPLNNVDSLANFIKKAAEKFPARHYVLMVYGHGGGFSPVWDTPSTRACVIDDFTEKSLAADNIVDAVKESGVTMQTIFAQCCVMGALENMAAYSQVFDYGILSAEVTGGGYFPEYLVKLTEAGDDVEKLKTKSRELVDYYVDEACKKHFNDQNNSGSYTSHGFYDLTQMPQMMTILKEAADWYSSIYTDTQMQEGIDDALRASVSCINLGVGTATEDFLQTRKELQDIIAAGYESPDQLSTEKLKEIYTSIFDLLYGNQALGYGYCMSDVLRQTALVKDLSDEKRAEVQAIYNKYMAQLKKMAYIRTTVKPSNADADYEYIYASPTINLFAMNEDNFVALLQGGEENLYNLFEAFEQKEYDKAEEICKEMFEGTPYAKNATLAEVTHNYTSSVFDKQVKWSNFLKLLDFNPSVIINPDRMQVTLNMINNK